MPCELVGVYPEATISRSFEIKEFKTGAARMAVEAGVPIVPVIVWGAQRVWTKGHPKKLLRPKVPIVVLVGEPIEPTLGTGELNKLLHSRMQHLLERAQEMYGPHPAGEFWVPRRLGGRFGKSEKPPSMLRKQTRGKRTATSWSAAPRSNPDEATRSKPRRAR